ncbi:MAG: hypothetical protein IJZ29_02980 [Clostridia bacterium]|nr:hypothetical protein [Clostridia bacterium]
MKLILNIRAVTTCKINLENVDLIVNANENAKLKVSFDNEFYLQVFPIDDENKYLPFIAKFEYKERTLKTASTLISIIKYSDTIYDLNIIPTQTLLNNKSKLKKTINNPNEKQLLYENGKLQITSNNKTLSFNINKPLTRPKFSYCENHIMLSSKEPIGTHLYIIDERNNKIKYIFCTSFKQEVENITTILNLNDYAKHLQITKYNLNTLEISDKYIAYKQPPKTMKNIKIIPYCFMQNIKAKDFKEARKYLEKEFESQLTNETLTSYFDKFVNITTPQVITPLPLTVCLLYKQSPRYFTTRYFSFEFNNENKITNIHETHL